MRNDFIFPGNRDKESIIHICIDSVGCVCYGGNFTETNRLALNGLKLWSPVTQVSSVVLEAQDCERKL